MTFIIMNPFQLDVFCFLVLYPPARQQARKNCDLFHNGTAETNLGDLSAYLSKAYFVCSENAPDIQNEMLVQIMKNIDEPLDEHVRIAVEMMDADIAHNFKIKNLSSSIGISRSHLTSLLNAAFGLPPYQWLLQRRLEATQRQGPLPWGWERLGSQRQATIDGQRCAGDIAGLRTDKEGNRGLM